LYGIAIFTILVVLLNNHVDEFVFPLSLVFISLSLLTIYSMRSSQLFGYDIQTEYRIFQTTKDNLFWSMANMPKTL
jgi:uncharacterized membrane protein